MADENGYKKEKEMSVDCCEHPEGIATFDSRLRCPICDLEDKISELRHEYESLEEEFEEFKIKYDFQIKMAYSIERSEDNG